MAPMLIQEVDEEPRPPTTLELTPVEATFRTLLLDVAKYIDGSPQSSDESQVTLPPELAAQPLTLRFTGGWVRDKLLGVPSNDIDVAINKMTGYQFGLKLKDYLSIPGNPEKYGLEGVATTDKQSQKAGATDKSKTVGGLHKIEANPEKSKHLETVTTKILGLDIDLVNLRKETYTDDSRNPQMEFGTPEEDALRRDATVNAMFYNINNGEIEDFTEQGHDDMRAKIIRTPLEPYQTFKDDPLRVLRLIRFASRLEYQIEDTALSAMRNSEIKDTLRRKISRERVGVELEKALRGPNPHEALRLVFELDLYETIFSDPTVEMADHYRPDTEGWRIVIDALRDILDGGKFLEVAADDRENRFLAWELAAIVPYRDAPQAEALEPGRKAPPPIAATVAREGVKATNKVSEVIVASVRHQEEISDLVDRLREQKRKPEKTAAGEVDAGAPDVLGMALRKWGSSWRIQVIYSMLSEISNNPNSVESIERKYTDFMQRITDLKLLDAHFFKPLLDGKALAKALKTPPGPWMKDALDVVMAYQLRHPGEATAEDAIKEVEAVHQQQNGDKKGGELTSALVHHFLTLTIRPLFQKAQPKSVTEAGRKNTTAALPPKLGMENPDETATKPWKANKDTTTLPLLRWCIQALTPALTEHVWHLTAPPLLTLLDDWEPRHKTLGAQLSRRLLSCTPPSLLHKTGLADVFAEALTSCLTYLPPLTLEPDALPLQHAVYPALLTLATTRWPTDETHTRTPKQTADRVKFLDTLLRNGVLYAYTSLPHLSHPALTAAILTHLSPILDALGVEAVKHLQFVMPMLTETFARPLPDGKEAEKTEVVRSATRALRAVALSCWPRMVVYRGEVLKGLVVGWMGCEDEGVRVEMKEIVGMVGAVVREAEDVDWDAECKAVAEAEPRAAGLFER